MTIITMSSIPSSLRGDLTKWLFEISTGVYVGNVSARVREELWDRICSNCKEGQATMVYSARNEQRLRFQVHNSNWMISDNDGLILMKRPHNQSISNSFTNGFSKAYQNHQYTKHSHRKGMDSGRKQDPDFPDSYAVLDFETTGLNVADSHIIEIGALKVVDSTVIERFNRLIRLESPVPSEIVKLTGITNDQLDNEGVPLEEALAELVRFISRNVLVGYNISFDINFLQQGLKKCGLDPLKNKCIDTLNLCKRLIPDAPNFKLPTVLSHLEIESEIHHRSISDGEAINQLYLQLMKIHQTSK